MKRVLIIGGTSAIGEALIRLLRQSSEDYSVHLTARNLAKLPADLQDGNRQYHLDYEPQLSPFERDAVVTRFIDSQHQMGRTYDLVVHCVGVFLHRPVYTTTSLVIDVHQYVNALGPISLTTAMIEARLLNVDSHVLFLSSTLTSLLGGGESMDDVVRVRPAAAIGYGASKTALQSYIEYLAPHAIAHGVRINSYTPALTQSPLTHRRGQTPAAAATEILRFIRGRVKPCASISNADSGDSGDIWMPEPAGLRRNLA
jgi:NAD(P)-dependent dehydrogenase (short-subunit alcohol dehydrogenase family)